MNTPQKEVSLGVLVPDDGPIDYEWLGLEAWLEEHGLGDVAVRIERPPAEGDHVFDDLMRIGQVDNLLPATTKLAASGADVILGSRGSFIGGPAWKEIRRRRFCSIHRMASTTKP